MERRSGFSLVELMIVMGLTMLFTGISAIFGTQAIRNGEFDRVRETLRNDLIAAQTDAIAGTRDSNWGVKVFSNSLTRFKGSSYATRDTGFDLSTDFHNGVTISGTSEVSFTRPKGLPSSEAVFVVTDGTHTATATVYTVGGIDVQ